MTMHKALHPRDDVDILYVSRREGGRGLASIEGRSSKFRVGSRVRQTLEEGRRTYRPKRCGNSNEDEESKNP